MERVNIKIEGSFGDIPCIYRMQLGKTKKFFIWKTKQLKPSLAGLAKDLQRKIEKGCDDQDPFFKISSYMKANSVRNITIKVLVETEDLVRIIHKEHEILAAASEDKRNCLNNSFIPYLPGWIKSALDEEDMESVVGMISNPPLDQVKNQNKTYPGDSTIARQPTQREIIEYQMKSAPGIEPDRTDYFSDNTKATVRDSKPYYWVDSPSEKVTAPSFFAPPKGTYLIPEGIITGNGPDLVEYKGRAEEEPKVYEPSEHSNVPLHKPNTFLKKEVDPEDDDITMDDIAAIAAKLKAKE